MPSKKAKRARSKLTPKGEFTAIVGSFPEHCKREDGPCRNVVALGAGIVLAKEKAGRDVISAPDYAIGNALSELGVLANLAQWSGCQGPTEEGKCPLSDLMGQVCGVANFGSDMGLEKGTFKRTHGDHTGSSGGGYA